MYIQIHNAFMNSDVEIREIFHFLFLEIYFNNELIKKNITKDTIKKAILALESINWNDFKGQVKEFLEEDWQNKFNTAKPWEGLKNRVLEKLYEFI